MLPFSLIFKPSWLPSFLSLNGSGAGVGFPPLNGPDAHPGFIDSKRVSGVPCKNPFRQGPWSSGSQGGILG